ncbi:MAG: single-stranded-DNA-specific exonuclease RecJ [Kiloniellales bacterium]|jgi:single-stranded-DNA-specific exonuclease
MPSPSAPAEKNTQASHPGDGRALCLGVERSLLGRRWESRCGDLRLAAALSQRHGLPEIVGRVLAGRGVALEEAESHLNPTLRRLMPNPSQLKDMDRAVARLVAAIEGQETIAVFGDYDVDGATSAALLKRFLAAIGVPLRVYVPDRRAEGYGPNAPALLRLKAEGVSLVITVDCGTTAHESLAVAAEAGLDTLVIDHHAAEPRLPPAYAVVNPNRLDEDGHLGQLAAVGVTFVFLVGLNRALRDGGWYGRAGQTEPDLRAWLDLVALGTVCDVVPLTGLNRAFVAQGLKVLAGRGNVGLAALCDAARVDERPGTYHAGFILGPRINAGGRVGQSDLGAQLLATDDPGEAARLAEQLDGLNAERRRIERDVLDQALAQIEATAAEARGLVMAVAEGWHPGVIGIVASRLKERTNLPSLVVALENGVGKGSGRSVPGVDLGAAVIAARQSGLLINGGGHPMAAGLTVAEDRVEALRAFLDERLSRRIAEIQYRPSLGIDGALQPGGARSDLVEVLEQVGPYGAGNPEPRFAIPEARVAAAQVVGENHVRCTITGSDGSRLKGIAFRALDGALGPALLRTGGLPLHLAGKLRRDAWAGGQAVQFIIEDAARVGG